MAGADKSSLTEPFDFTTVMLGSEVMTGNNTDGNLRLTFFTPDGTPNFRTIVSPALAATLAMKIEHAANNIPSVTAALGLDVPAKRLKKATKSAVHFGQEYPTETMIALGILMVRVNLLENSLVKLLAAVAALSEKQSEALFYSTINMKARLDIIRSLAPVCGLSDYTYGLVLNALDKAKAVTDRRNELVHGHWTFLKDKFEVEVIEPHNAAKRTTHVVTTKSLETLAIDYRTAGTLAEGCLAPILHERSIAKNTA